MITIYIPDDNKPARAKLPSDRLRLAGWTRSEPADDRDDWQVDWTDPETGTVMGFYAAKDIQIGRESTKAQVRA